VNDAEFERRAQQVALWFVVAVLLAAGYALLALGGVAPAAPWSPVGQAT
jgi:hypothetical protein